MFAKMVMNSMYEKATRPEDLAWHSEEPTKLLDDAVSAVLATRNGRARALDLGCGAGIHSAYLARKGFEVTGIDLIPKAIELAATHAEAQGLDVDFVAADLLEWSAGRPFDLVLDSGCLHSLIHGSVALYKERLVSLIAPGGEYVLCHWGKRHAFDWRPIGPRRRAADDLAAVFAPELVEIARHEEVMTDVPMPFGPSILSVAMRFRSCR
jgi:2-polyprenyl-3-methyl-5-hydroxy-6-metoxy-1,4-benzoquinol methylase